MAIIATYVDILQVVLNNGYKNSNTTNTYNCLSWWERKVEEPGNICYEIQSQEFFPMYQIVF